MPSLPQSGKDKKESVSPARMAAFQVLLRVETRDSYAELLHSDLLKDLSAADKALATELVMGVLRWQSVLDTALSAAAQRQIAKTDAEVRIALRLGAYQILHLEKVPARAAVHQSVELVKAMRKRSAAPFVNAVLRKLGPQSATSESGPQASDASSELAHRYAHPEWLVKRWIENHGLAKAKLICSFGQERPGTTIRLADAAVENDLREEGIELAPGNLLGSARRVVLSDVTRTKAWRDQKVFVQDEASQLVALLVGTGRRILDCCAAPGGKTAAIAARNSHAFIVATELHPHRARLMSRLIADYPVHIVVADARRLPLAIQFDRILADLPCSGTGTLARNPEIKWKLRAEDIQDLQRRQIAILASAMQRLAPEGRILFSTCSLEPEEGEAVITAVLAENPEVKLLPVRPELERLREEKELVWNDLDSFIQGDFLRTIPGVHPCDGFFAAILAKR